MTFPARFLFLLVLIPALALSDVQPKGSLVRVFVDDQGALRPNFDAGVDIEGTSGRPGGEMEFVVGPEEARQLSRRSVSTTGPATMYFRTVTGVESQRTAYLLPPTPPSGVFDARFDTHVPAEYFGVAGDPPGRAALLNPTADEFRLTFYRREGGCQQHEILVPGTDGSIARLLLSDGVTLSAGIPADGRFELRTANTGVHPFRCTPPRKQPGPFQSTHHEKIPSPCRSRRDR